MKLSRLILFCVFFIVSADSLIAQEWETEVLSIVDTFDIYDVGSLGELIEVEIDVPNEAANKNVKYRQVGWKMGITDSGFILLDYAGWEMFIENTSVISTSKYSPDTKEHILFELLPTNRFLFSKDNSIIKKRWIVNRYSGEQEMPFLLIASWLHKTQNQEGAFKVLHRMLTINPSLKNSTNWMMGIFGNLYYNDMLSAFAYKRNSRKALYFGEHLATEKYEGFRYNREVHLLNVQLKSHSTDFYEFSLPIDESWLAMKDSLSRPQQIRYLLDRIRLLNCYQQGQPSNISYSDKQMSMSTGPTIKKYPVINPYNELLEMDISNTELKLFLPYLLSEEFITSFEYWRDFSYHRKLHPVADVVLQIMFQVTHKQFGSDNFFYAKEEEKKEVIRRISEWIEENKTTP